MSFLTKQQAAINFFELVSIVRVYGLTKYAVRSNQQPKPPPPTNKPVNRNTISGSPKKMNKKIYPNNKE